MTAKSPRMANRITTVSAWTAHGLAWTIWIIRAWQLFTPSFVEKNGPIVLSMLLVPVLLTYVSLATIHLVKPGQAKRKILLWCPAVALLAICMVLYLSYGIALLPAALALFVAAVADSRHRTAK